ncbi:MAG: hypothetical protein HY438_00955 [DPANN group archaeon]|nr:hypothetical protein [DPANN group archaeon]
MATLKIQYESCVKKLKTLYEQEWGWELENRIKGESSEQTLDNLIKQTGIIKEDIEDEETGEAWQDIMFALQYVEHLCLSVGYEKLVPVAENLLKLATSFKKRDAEGLEKTIYAIKGQSPPPKKIIKKIPVETLKPHIVDFMKDYATQIGQQYHIPTQDLLNKDNWKHDEDYSDRFGHLRRFFFRNGDAVWADIKITNGCVGLELLRLEPIDYEDPSCGSIFRPFARKTIENIK